MSKIKILYVGVTKNVGGVENFILNISSGINKNLFDIYFLVHQKPHIDIETKMKGIGEIIYVHGIKEAPFSFLNEIQKIYKNNRFDIVHLNECSAVYSIYVLPLLLNKNGTKLIIHSHNGSSKGINAYIHHFLKRIQNLKADAFWACSDVAAKWMFGNKKCEIIKNGIDVQRFAFDEKGRNDIKTEFLIHKDDIVVGSIGRLEPQKNYKRLIDIFSEYHKINQHSKLLIVGDGGLKAELSDKIQELHLSDYVILAGIRNDIPSILSSFDIFVMPSLFEGLPFVGVEAQANGLPILLSTNVSSELLISDKAHVFDLDTDDYSVAKMIEKIIKDTNRREFNSKVFRDAGLDLKDSIRVIEDKYLSMVMKDEIKHD